MDDLAIFRTLILGTSNALTSAVADIYDVIESAFNQQNFHQLMLDASARVSAFMMQSGTDLVANARASGIDPDSYPIPVDYPYSNQLTVIKGIVKLFVELDNFHHSPSATDMAEYRQTLVWALCRFHGLVGHLDLGSQARQLQRAYGFPLAALNLCDSLLSVLHQTYDHPAVNEEELVQTAMEAMDSFLSDVQAMRL